MAFNLTEKVIIEQLKAGNYVLSHSNEWCFSELILVIPKTAGRPKIRIEFKSYYWDEEEEFFKPWNGKAEPVQTVTLSTFWENQTIHLHNDEAKEFLDIVLRNYWSAETENRRHKITKEDATWAERFKKVFE
jgi:hypothetical protein